MANKDYIAIYPASPCLQIGDKKIDMFENLRIFKKQLEQSMQGVLSGKRRAVLIRIAHVGLTEKGGRSVEKENPQCKKIFYCEKVYEAQQRCYFVPIIGVENAREYFGNVEYWVNSGQGTQCSTLKYSYGFHTDPLIFARTSDGRLVESITYGEDDVETTLAWLEIPFKEFGEETPRNSVDAYVLFNSTFYMEDYEIDFQVIHGGFKAEEWDDISCFRRCNELKNYRHRVEVNPHWIWRDSYGILMSVGDEKTWFFSMPIAPPPLYFKAQTNKDKINASKVMIGKLLGNVDSRKLISKASHVLEQLHYDEILLQLMIDIYRDREKTSTDSQQSSETILETMLKLKEIEKEVHEIKDYYQMIQAASKFLNQYGFTPKILYNSDKHLYEPNYSYLDLYLTKPEGGQLKPSWYIAILLLLLIDTYLDTVKQRFRQVCGQA